MWQYLAIQDIMEFGLWDCILFPEPRTSVQMLTFRSEIIGANCRFLNQGCRCLRPLDFSNDLCLWSSYSNIQEKTKWRSTVHRSMLCPRLSNLLGLPSKISTNKLKSLRKYMEIFQFLQVHTRIYPWLDQVDVWMLQRQWSKRFVRHHGYCITSNIHIQHASERYTHRLPTCDSLFSWQNFR